MNELLHWVWLSLSCTPGSDTFKKLITKFQTPIEIYQADEDSISSCIGTQSHDYNSIMEKDLARAEEVLSFCQSKNIGILTYSDSDFPQSLREIDEPPVLLYYRGKLVDFNESTFISVVGTRRLSDYGRKNAFTVSYDLASSGAVIVSGMAIGIDGVSLAGALSANMPTVAFLGSGIDVCYPIQHRRLAREIVKHGCVMTEYPPSTRPERYNFPRRNRLISGLSSATVLIEGPEKSGALITARCAAKQGKPVYALPGNVGNKNSEASNILIKNGARLFTTADDIISDFDKSMPGRLNPFKLALRPQVDMNHVLSELQVSCVAPGDDIFRSSRRNKTKNSIVEKQENTQSAQPVEDDKRSESDLSGFDKTAVEIYKKIPRSVECTVESLVNSEFTLRAVMQALLKLEMARFVVMLPGDRVKRNI